MTNRKRFVFLIPTAPRITPFIFHVGSQAVLESLNEVLEVDKRQGKRYALVAGKLQLVAQGFFVIATIRGSQRNLTPALASRFLSYPVCPSTGPAGMEQLVKCYLSDFDAQRQHYFEERVREVIKPIKNKFPIGPVSDILKAFRAWWRFSLRTVGTPEPQTERNAMVVISRILLMGSEPSLAEELVNSGEEWPVSYTQLLKTSQAVGQQHFVYGGAVEEISDGSHGHLHSVWTDACASRTRGGGEDKNGGDHE